MRNLLLLIVILISGVFAQKTKQMLAVMDFAGDKSMEVENLKSITNKFQSELSKTGQFTLLDRSQVDAILKEQGFQQTGICSGDCQVQMGQMLGADKMITGRVSKIEDLYAVSVNLVDVATGSILQSETAEIEGGLSAVLTKIAPMLAKKIKNGNPTKEEKASVKNSANEKPESSISSKSTKWWWIGGSGIALAGGITAWILTQKPADKEVSSVRTQVVTF